MAFIPKGSEFIDKVKKNFASQNFMKLIKTKLVKVEPSFCEINMPYNVNLTQQHSFFHAGIVGTIADNAASYAAFSLMDKNSSILTVEFKLNLIALADGELLIGKAKVLKYGKTLTICRSDVFISKNGVEKSCAAS